VRAIGNLFFRDHEPQMGADSFVLPRVENCLQVREVEESTQLHRVGVDTKPMQRNRTTSTRCWEPGSASVESSELDEIQPKLTWTPVLLEAEILSALDAPKQDHETFDAAFRRKEHEIGAVLCRLTPADLLALERRLTLSLADDPIAARFSRLVAARRNRLVSFISEMRRRQPSRLAHVGARHG
jgi:hypothetical protein